MPADRAASPWLLVPPGVAGRKAVLVSPYERGSRGLTDAEQDAVAAMQGRVADTLAAAPMPRVPFWIDPGTGRTTRLDHVGDGWINRRLADHHAVAMRTP
jgi:hypothetical protein